MTELGAQSEVFIFVQLIHCKEVVEYERGCAKQSDMNVDLIAKRNE